MSYNDRFAEAAVVLRNGGVIPAGETRAYLASMFEAAADGLFPPDWDDNLTDLIHAIRDTNPSIYQQVIDGDLPGLYEETPDG